jgi:uncharacterized protein
MIQVEVVYCPAPGVVDRVALTLADGSTVAQALDASGVLARHGLHAGSIQVGIWGRIEEPDRPLRDLDRVEVYRPLQCDPKEARRLRYKQRPTSKKAR